MSANQWHHVTGCTGHSKVHLLPLEPTSPSPFRDAVSSPQAEHYQGLQLFKAHKLPLISSSPLSAEIIMVLPQALTSLYFQPFLKMCRHLSMRNSLRRAQLIVTGPARITAQPKSSSRVTNRELPFRGTLCGSSALTRTS